MNHGFSIDLRPRFRYRYSVIDQNWNRILQFPVCTNENEGTCADTIELALTPSVKSRWEYIPQLRIHRHRMPFMRGDVFQNAIPIDVWDKLVDIVGINMVEFMAYSPNEQILDAIDWSKYDDYVDDGIVGVPFQRIKNAEQIARETDNMRAKFALREAGRDNAPIGALPAFVTGNRSKTRENA